MPKEKISCIALGDHGWHVELSWTKAQYSCGKCHVSWDKNVTVLCPECGTTDNINTATTGHAQIASVNPDSPFEFAARDNEDGSRTREVSTGWRVTLGAHEIDQIIHVLHRVRRQVFHDVEPELAADGQPTRPPVTVG